MPYLYCMATATTTQEIEMTTTTSFPVSLTDLCWYGPTQDDCTIGNYLLCRTPGGATVRVYKQIDGDEVLVATRTSLAWALVFVNADMGYKS